MGNETDRIGSAIAIGNVGVGKGDLVVGKAGEEWGSGPEEGQVYVYSGNTGDTLGSPYRNLDQIDFINAMGSDTIFPAEGRGTDGFGASLVLLKQPGYSTRAIVIGAPTDTVEGNQSGAIFQYAVGMVTDRKLDQKTMNFATALTD